MPNPNIGRYMLGTTASQEPPSVNSSTMKRGGKRKSKIHQTRKRETHTRKRRREEPTHYPQTGARYCYKKTRCRRRKYKTDW